MPVSLKNIQLPKSRAYRSGSEYEPYAFFLEGLVNSTQFNFLLGYFSSSAINILALGFAKFIANGGNVRLIINQFLSTLDKDAILEGQRLKQEDVSDKQIDFKNLATDLSDRGKHFFKCLAYLIAKNRIEIICITPKEGNGISHFKSGIFSDGINQLYFKGSCNFTASGLISNLEELEVKESWDTDKDRAAINEYCNYFDNLFCKKADFVDYLPIKDAIETIKECFGESDLNKLLKDEQILIDNYLKKGTYSKRTKGILHELKDEIIRYQNTPKFPFPEGPRNYQMEAYNSWVANSYKGIFAMATGTGKTITSLNCLLEDYKKIKAYRAIIVVPTIALVEQWKKECDKFNFRNSYLINSKCKWNNEVSALKTEYLLNKLVSYILIVTYASFVKSKFQLLLQSLPTDTLFIADEAHNLGAKNVSKILDNIILKKRIGLSATPDRKYDDLGNDVINKFFNNPISYTFSYSMEEAIKNKVLCNYKYYPHIVSLTAVEQEQYVDISKALAKLFNSDSRDSFFDNPVVQMKLLERKRIIHKAENKLAVFNNILKDEFEKRGNLKYTLVYVPEGVVNVVSDEEFTLIYQDDDIYNENTEDERIIDVYTRTVRNIDDRILVGQYTSRTPNREYLLKEFATGDMDVLTSMKCLDEGVDVPRAELAIFCASTGNPRQFVQRRGRVLRKHDKKLMATIHDLVVVPLIDKDSETFEMERNMFQRELERVVNFSSLALNKMDTYLQLKNILDHYKLNLYQQ